MVFDSKLLKLLLVLILLPILTLPAFGQEQSQQQIKLTSGGTINVGFLADPQNPNPGDQTQLRISFMNKQTKEIQQHIDYRVTLTKGQNQVFGIPLTHTAEGSVSIPYEFQDAGDYTVTVYVEGILFQPIPPETVAFSVSVGSLQTIQPTQQPAQPTSGKQKSGCLIATAAFGSELSPQVQFLREFRDNHILLTRDGSSFMTVFNAWYYSFSPSVADYERNQLWLQQVVKVSIYPLLGILTTSEKAYSLAPGEYGSLSAGLIASPLIGGVYFWPAALASKSIRNGKKPNERFVITIISSVVVLTFASIFSGDMQFMMVTTSMLVVSFVVFGAMYSSWSIVKIVRKARENPSNDSKI